MRVWIINASRMKHCPAGCGGEGRSCCRRVYRELGTVVAATIHDALDRAVSDEFTSQLADDEDVCIAPETRPASVYDLIRNPQL